jgi:gamma-glutamyl-gamma-aminobutyrate hydrolase PuuD
MTCTDTRKGVLAMLVALIFSSPGGQLDRAEAHLQDLGYADISTKRAVMEGRERGAFGPVKGTVVLERNGRMCNLVVHKFKSRAFHNFALTYLGSRLRVRWGEDGVAFCW